MRFYPDALGCTGAFALFSANIYSTRAVWYVNSVTGVDAGTTPSNLESPFASLPYAVTVCGNGDFIVLAAEHDETLVNVVDIPPGVILIGAGGTSTMPEATLRVGEGGGITTNYFGMIANIYFAESLCTVPWAWGMGPDVRYINCYFECGAWDTGAVMYWQDDPTYAGYVVNCTFKATSAGCNVAMLSENRDRFVHMTNVTFDGGTVGFVGPAFLNQTTSITMLHGWNISLLNGADMVIMAESSGFVHVTTATGGARVDW